MRTQARYSLSGGAPDAPASFIGETSSHEDLRAAVDRLETPDLVAVDRVSGAVVYVRMATRGLGGQWLDVGTGAGA